MTSINDAAFAAYAGQAVQGGIRTTPYNSPVQAFGNPTTAASIAALSAVAGGLLNKVSSVMIHETPVYSPDILKIFNRYDMPYGVAVEDFGFSAPSPNMKSDGTCIPRHTDTGVGQLSAINISVNENINIYDKEINRGVTNPQDVARYVAEKMKLLQAGYMKHQMTAAIQLISNCVPGKHASISSHTSSDGTGTSVTYSDTPAGWAGVVKNHADWVIPEVSALGTEPTIVTEVSGGTELDMVLDFLQEIKSLCAGMKYPSTSFNKLGRETFSTSLNVVMETHVLDAFDRVIRDSGKNYYEGATSRGFINEISGVRLVEIPSFSAIPAYDRTTYPASTDYSGQRLACAIFDSDMPGIFTSEYSLESQRCMAERMTGYNLRAEQAWRMWTGSNGAVILCDHTADA